ncbi:glucose-dependent insulinotropic receptor-like [Eublepharis macularius]|uniref:Glucose-dependent insulinotropic receptor-like n=1 Tax=Eublepharis macularius TaxID=481883 RepID=A0AA97JJA6_EUBMA|nr:glucose-dependent insulinotropic receptor-like [Eublepharis macularius]
MPNVAYAVLHSLLSILIPSTNLLVIIVICQLRKKKPSRNYVFILNLAAADLLVGVMCFGETLDDAIDIALDRNLTICLLRICMSITPCIGSILTLLLVSLDRYLAVKLPLYYPTLMRKKPIIFSLVVLWSVSVLVGHMPLISSYLKQSNFTGECGLLSATKSDYLFIICFGIFIPALLTLICLHISVGRIAYLQHKRIRHACLHMETSSAHRRHFKALRTVLVVIICFILFWGPYYVTAIVRATCSSCKLSQLLKDLLFILGETNSLINPFIYSLYCKDIRTQLSKMMKCKAKGQIKPRRSNDLALIHFNMRTQRNLASGGAMRHDLSGDQASNSPSVKSSSDFKTVFSIS